MKSVFSGGNIASNIFGLLSFGRVAEQITGPPAQVTVISPEDSATNLQLDMAISWGRPSMAQSYDVYFGTVSGSLTLVSEGQLARTYVPEGLELDGTYIFRIDAVNSEGTTAGKEVSFSIWAAADIWTDEQTGIPWTDDDGNYIPHEKD